MSVPLEERFFSKIDTNGPIPERCPELGACWIWQGEITPRGYGMIYVKRRSSRAAHRVSWEIENKQPFPEGLDPDHLCCNRACVNPKHIEPVTRRENILRARRDKCKRGHDLFGENLYLDPAGLRRCRTCRHNHRRYYQEMVRRKKKEVSE